MTGIRSALTILPLLWATTVFVATEAAARTVDDTIHAVQPKMVKIYGAGGFRGMEAYQSGALISPEGHILTVFSYVLDTDELSVVLHDGSRHPAKLLGADPRLEIAVLKIDVLKIEAENLPYFDLTKAVDAEAGTRVLAFSNLFGVAAGNEPVSVQHGVVSVKTNLAARRGVFETTYHGPVYVLDAGTNNPGAAGGILVTRHGQLLGMLGKELRNTLTNTWLNYAVPVAELRPSVEAIREGRFIAQRDSDDPKPERSLELHMVGITLVPDILDRTPPYVDRVQPGSPASQVGLKPDDLVLLVGDRLVQSCKALRDELQYIDFEDPVKLTVLRGQQLIEVTLQTRLPAASNP